MSLEDDSAGAVEDRLAAACGVDADLAAGWMMIRLALLKGNSTDAVEGERTILLTRAHAGRSAGSTQHRPSFGPPSARRVRVYI